MDILGALKDVIEALDVRVAGETQMPDQAISWFGGKPFAEYFAEKASEPVNQRESRADDRAPSGEQDEDSHRCQ